MVKNISKYNELVLLVHPLYDVFFKTDSNILNYTIVSDLKDPNNLQKRKQIAQIKKTLAIYGREIAKYKNSPNTLFVLIKPSILRESDMLINNYTNIPKNESVHKLVQEMFSVYENTMKRFYEYGSKTLQNRFQVSDFDLDFSRKRKFLDRSILNNFDSNIKIKSFGEYFSKKEGCVHYWSDMVKDLLKKNKIKVLEINRLEKKSMLIDGYLTRFKKGILPHVISGSERRKVLGSHRKQRTKNKLK